MYLWVDKFMWAIQEDGNVEDMKARKIKLLYMDLIYNYDLVQRYNTGRR
jgi:hypothetical protein